jgi:hypothetical protein
LRGLIGNVGRLSQLSAGPGEVLGIVEDLQDGRADEDDTLKFLTEVGGLVDQGRRFLDAVGR